MARLFTVILLLCLAAPVWAQNNQEEGQEDEKDKDPKIGAVYGVHTGPLLPNQIQGLTEIMPSFGMRYGFGMRKGVLEVGLLNSNAYGSSYFNASGSYRGDIRLDDMTAIVLAGLDIHYWNPPGETFKSSFGGHVGGGFLAHIGDLLYFRADMKFNVNPGTALYIGFGFEWRQPGGDAAEGAAEQGAGG